MQILYPTGLWMINRGSYPIYDPEGLVVLPAQVPVKARHTAWLKAQPTVELIEDPTKPEVPVETKKSK